MSEGKVLLELSHEDHYRLLDVLRISKASAGFPSNEDERRIMDARRCLHLPCESRWKFYDWTPDDEAKEREEERRRNEEFYKLTQCYSPS